VTELGELLAQVGQLVDAQRRAFETGPVRAVATLPELRAALGGPTPETPTDSSAVIRALAAEAAPGVVGIPGPRYFGFVIGGSHPAALAADWLTSGWDKNSQPPELPAEIVEKTRAKYIEAFEQLTGEKFAWK